MILFWTFWNSWSVYLWHCFGFPQVSSGETPWGAAAAAPRINQAKGSPLPLMSVEWWERNCISKLHVIIITHALSCLVFLVIKAKHAVCLDYLIWSETAADTPVLPEDHFNYWRTWSANCIPLPVVIYLNIPINSPQRNWIYPSTVTSGFQPFDRSGDFTFKDEAQTVSQSGSCPFACKLMKWLRIKDMLALANDGTKCCSWVTMIKNQIKIHCH